MVKHLLACVAMPDKLHMGTALILAASQDHSQIVEILLQNNADPNARTKFNISSLHRAARYGYMQTAIFLLEYKADVNAFQPSCGTPLFDASKNGHLGICELLIRHKADPKMKHNPICAAALEGHVQVCDLLLKSGGNPNKTFAGWPPLCAAAFMNHLDMCDLLLKYGADPNATVLLKASVAPSVTEPSAIPDTAVHQSASEKLRNITAVQQGRFTSLQLAQQRECKDVVALLVSRTTHSCFFR